MPTPNVDPTAGSSAAKPARTRKTYSEEEIIRGLVALALEGGNAAQAARNLKAQGEAIPEATLRSWKDTRREAYLKLRTEKLAEVEKVVIGSTLELVMLADEVQRAALELELKRVKASKVRDASASARNAAVAKGVGLDKLIALQNRPQVIEIRSGDSVFEDLAKKFPGLVVDGVATEIPDAPELTPGGVAADTTDDHLDE